MFGRQNIEDVNFHAYVYPANWITVDTQYHIFHLANSRDALYTTGGGVLRSDPTGNSGTDVGSELDVVVNWHIDRHTDIVTAYGHFFAGDFLKATGPKTTNDTDTVWLLYNLRW